MKGGTYIAELVAAAFGRIYQPTSVAAITQYARSHRVDCSHTATFGSHRNGVKNLGRTSPTAESEAVWVRTPAIPVTNAVAIETANPMSPKMRPALVPRAPYHHVRTPTRTADKTMNPMYSGVNLPPAAEIGMKA